MEKNTGTQRLRGRWLASAAGLLLVGHAAAQGMDCEGLTTGLTSVQRAKFSLTQEACPGGLNLARNAVLAPQSDAQQIPADGDVKWHSNLVIAAPERLPIRSPQQTLHSSAMRRAMQLAPEIDAAALGYDIDPLLLHAIAHVESRHNPNAVSPAGALGLMQVMPATARRFGVDHASALRDARTNLAVSARYLKALHQRFGNNLPLVLAAYNAGEGAVERCGRCIPPFAETRGYVRDVLARYDVLKTAAHQLDMSAAALR